MRTTKEQDERRESDLPAGGARRREQIGGSGVYQCQDPILPEMLF